MTHRRRSCPVAGRDHPLANSFTEARQIRQIALRENAVVSGSVRFVSEAAFETARTGIRSRHPDYSDSQIRLAEIRMRLGDDLFRAAFPGRPLLPA